MSYSPAWNVRRDPPRLVFREQFGRHVISRGGSSLRHRCVMERRVLAKRPAGNMRGHRERYATAALHQEVTFNSTCDDTDDRNIGDAGNNGDDSNMLE